MNRLSLLLSVLVLCVGCGSSPQFIEVDAPTEVFEVDPSRDVVKPAVDTVLPTGARARVLDADYGKEFLVYKVELLTGRVGFVIANDKVRVVNATK